mgnify:CR=1 FL=1
MRVMFRRLTTLQYVVDFIVAVLFFITAVIAACYVAGAWELLRFRNATLQLQRVLSRLDQAPADLEFYSPPLVP